jgi:developmental checkpoint coupling sporulation initiation to replication initiation
MNMLSDDLLLESYFAAMKLRLDPNFIRMLAIEMMRRNMKPAALRIGA